MNKNILDKNVQDYISKNLFTDILEIILKKQIFPKVSNKEIAEQISAKMKAKKSYPPILKLLTFTFQIKLTLNKLRQKRQQNLSQK